MELVMNDKDRTVMQMLRDGRLRVDMETGLVTSTKANDPRAPIGSLTKKGYLRATLTTEGVSIAVMVHRIVCVAANGLPPPEKSQVNHVNGVKTDNRPQNLEWTTNKENMRHAAKLGVLGVARGAKHYKAKLTPENVSCIRDLRRRGHTYAELALQYGVSDHTIYLIVKHKSWKRLD